MLQIKNISKKYVTGDLTQVALNDVSLNFRSNEFVAILGTSGSGKTTLLNIIGGLDRYDSGDLIIKGISTKNYKDKDWDSYRNHTIGFVFQSYNLIPHQTVLSNVELALTISGISKVERTKRAEDALKEVGLGEHMHKKPNQLSGGQMQRVAIARALVNNPSIVLADEPTGALDSETSVQIMDMLKEVAKDRLVIMVTHNPELAEEYATRIVKVKDGKIIDDNNPYLKEVKENETYSNENMGKSSMSLGTSLALSFNNLKTKKARTFLTSFAGSIGIIGIAMILSLSNGVNYYITNIQKDAMTSFPIVIEKETIDLTSLMEEQSKIETGEVNHEFDGVYVNNLDMEIVSNITSNIIENNLKDFKTYIDNKDNEIYEYIGENGIVYNYDVKFDVYSYDKNKTLVNADGSTLNEKKDTPMNSMLGMMNSGSSLMSFGELLENQDGSISSSVTSNYDLLYGKLPEEYNELLLVLDKNNEIPSTTLYELGILPTNEYKEIVKKLENGETLELENRKLDYQEICNQTFYLIPECDFYKKNEGGNFEKIEDTKEIEKKFDNAIQLKIVGIVKDNGKSENKLTLSPIGYRKSLTTYIMNYTDNSEVVKAQKENPNTNILNGVTFEVKSDEEKIEELKKYFLTLPPEEQNKLFMGMNVSMGMSYSNNVGVITDIANPMDYNSLSQGNTEGISIGTPIGNDTNQGANSIGVSSNENFSYSTNVSNGMDLGTLSQGHSYENSDGYGMSGDDSISNPNLLPPEEQIEMMFSQMDKETLLAIYDNYIPIATYEENLEKFGWVDESNPSAISIYVDTFEDKEKVEKVIEDYNKTVSEENKVSYTDYVGMLMSSVTTIIDAISYVLIAFVSVSLVVSSIMIGIITYISVLERTKEIGILRAMGASKANITNVFNAETFIIGLCSGLLGIIITLLLLIPTNLIIHNVANVTSMNAILPIGDSIILIVLSIVLTLIGGFVPANKAAEQDPVIALRSE